MPMNQLDRSMGVAGGTSQPIPANPELASYRNSPLMQRYAQSSPGLGQGGPQPMTSSPYNDAMGQPPMGENTMDMRQILPMLLMLLAQGAQARQQPGIDAMAAAAPQGNPLLGLFGGQ